MSWHSDKSAYWYGNRSSRGHPREEREHNYRGDTYRADTRYSERSRTGSQYREPYESNRRHPSNLWSDSAHRHEDNTGRSWRDRRPSGHVNIDKEEFASESQYSRRSRGGRERLSYDYNSGIQRTGYYDSQRGSERRQFRNPGTERSRSYDSYERNSDQYSHHFPVSVEGDGHNTQDKGFRQGEKISIDYQHKSYSQKEQAKTGDGSIYRQDKTLNSVLGQTEIEQNYKEPDSTITNHRQKDMSHMIDEKHFINKNITGNITSRPAMSFENIAAGNTGEVQVDLTSVNPNHSARLSSVCQNVYASQTEINNDNRTIDVSIGHAKVNNLQVDCSTTDPNLSNVEGNQASAQLQETMMNISSILSKLQTKLKPSVSEGVNKVSEETKNNVVIQDQSGVTGLSIEKNLGEQAIESIQKHNSGNQVIGTSSSDFNDEFDNAQIDSYNQVKIPGIMSPEQEYENENRSTEQNVETSTIFDQKKPFYDEAENPKHWPKEPWDNKMPPVQDYENENRCTEQNAETSTIFYQKRSFYDEAENLKHWHKKSCDSKEVEKNGERRKVRDEEQRHTEGLYRHHNYRDGQKNTYMNHDFGAKCNNRDVSIRHRSERQPQNHERKDRKFPNQFDMQQPKKNDRHAHQHGLYKHVERDRRDFQKYYLKDPNKDKDAIFQKTLQEPDKDVSLKRINQTSTDTISSSTVTSVRSNISVPSQDGKGPISKRSLKGFKIPKLKSSNDKNQIESKSNEVLISGSGQTSSVKDSSASTKVGEMKTKKHKGSANTQTNIFDKLNLVVAHANMNKAKEKSGILSETAPQKHAEKSNCEVSNKSVNSNRSGICGKLEQFLSKDKNASKTESESISADQKLSYAQEDTNNKKAHSKDRSSSTGQKDSATALRGEFNSKCSGEEKAKSEIKDLHFDKGQVVWKNFVLQYPKIQLKNLTALDIANLNLEIGGKDLCDKEFSENLIDDLEDGVYMEIGSDDETQVSSPDLEIIEDDIAVAIAESFEDDLAEIEADFNTNKKTDIKVKEEVIADDEPKNSFSSAPKGTVEQIRHIPHDHELHGDIVNELHGGQKQENDKNFEIMAFNPASRTADCELNNDSHKQTCSASLPTNDTDDNSDSDEKSQSILDTESGRQLPVKPAKSNASTQNYEESSSIGISSVHGKNIFSDNETVVKPLSLNSEKNRSHESSDEDELPVIKPPRAIPRTRVLPRKSISEMVSSTDGVTTEHSIIIPVRKMIFKSKKTMPLNMKDNPGNEADVEDNLYDEPTQKYDFGGAQTHCNSDSDNADNISQYQGNQSGIFDVSENVPKLEGTEVESEISNAEVKQEPSWLKNGYTQEPDTIFISDDNDDNDIALNASQPIISLNSSDSENGSGRGSFRNIKREKDELEKLDIHDPDYWSCSSPDDNSGKESDFDQDDFYEMVSRLSEPTHVDDYIKKDDKNAGNVSDADIYHFSDSSDSIFNAKDDIKDKTDEKSDEKHLHCQHQVTDYNKPSDLAKKHDCKTITTESDDKETQIIQDISVFMQDTQVDVDSGENESNQVSALEYQSEYFSDDSSSLLSKDCKQKSGISSATEKQGIGVKKSTGNSPIIIEDVGDEESIDSMSEYSDESDWGDLFNLPTQKYDMNDHDIEETKPGENKNKDVDGKFRLDKADSEIKEANKALIEDKNEKDYDSKTQAFDENLGDYLLLTQINDSFEHLSIEKETDSDLKSTEGQQSESEHVTTSSKELTEYTAATQIDMNIKKHTEENHKPDSSKHLPCTSKENADIQTLDGSGAIDSCYKAETQLDRDFLDLTSEEEYEKGRCGHRMTEDTDTQNYDTSDTERNDYIIETQIDSHLKVSNGYELGTQVITKSSESHVERSNVCIQQHLQEDCEELYEDPQYEMYLKRYVSPSKLHDKLGIQFDHSFHAEQSKIKFLDDDLYINKAKRHEVELSPYLAETQHPDETSKLTREDHQFGTYTNDTQVDTDRSDLTANLSDTNEDQDEHFDPYLSLTQIDEPSNVHWQKHSEGQAYSILTQIDDTEIEIHDFSPDVKVHGKHPAGSSMKGKSLSKTMKAGSKITTPSCLGKRPHPSSSVGNTSDESDAHTKLGRTFSKTGGKTPAKKTKFDLQDDSLLDDQENLGPAKMPFRSERQSIVIDPLPMNSRSFCSREHAVPQARSQSFLNARKADSVTKQGKDDTWLSKKTTIEKSKTKPNERKRNKSSDTTSSIKAGISDAKSRLEERNMKYISNPGSFVDPSRRQKQSSSLIPTHQDNDVDCPTLSQVISKGYPILDESMLHRKQQKTTSDVTSEVTTSTSTLVTNTITMTTTSITTTVSSNIPSSSSSVSVPSSKAKRSNTAKVNPGSEKSSRETNRDKEKSSHHKRDDHRSSSSKHKSSHHKSDRDMKHDGRSRKKSDKSDEARKDSMSSGKDKHDSGERHTCDKRNQGFNDKSNHHRKDKKDNNKSDPKGKSMDKDGSRTHSGKEKDKENLAGSSKPSTSKQSEDKVNNKIHDRSTINNNIANVTKGVECGDCVSDKNMSTKQAHVNSSEKSAHVKSNSRSPLSSGIAFNNNLSTGNSGNTESVKDLNRKKTTSNNAESSGVIPASVVTATSETVSRSNYKISPNIQKNDKMGNVQNKKVTWSDTVVSKQGPPQNNTGRSQNIHNNLGVPSSLSAKSLMKIPLGPTVVPSALPHQNDPLPPDLLKLKNPLTWESVLAIILKWKSTWFEERDKMEMSGLKKCPPPNVIEEFGKRDTNELLPLVERYTSLEEYVHKFMLPLLMHETWQSLYSDWREKKTRGRLHSLKLFLNHQESCRKNLQEYTLIGLMSREERKQWSSLGKGDLITLKLYERLTGPQMSNENVPKEILGVVDSVSYKDSNVVVERMCQQIPEFAQLRRPHSTQIVLTVRVRKRSFNPSNSPLPEIQPVSSILTTERQINALSNFGNSPLCRDLLYPTTNSTYCDRAVASSSHERRKLNESQSMAVNSAVRIVSHVSNPTPRICLLQGPPGTGKSYTIINIIHRIVKENKGKCRICLTAPSHAAVDELVRKIHRMNHEAVRKPGNTWMCVLTVIILMANKSNKVKLVRLGKKHSIHQDVQGYAVDILVQRRLGEILLEKKGEVPQSLQAERRALDTKISTIESNIKASKDMYQIQKWNNDLKRHMKDKENLESKFHIDKSQIHPGMEKRAKSEILNRAHVIAGTLSSMGSALLKQYLPQNNMFDCVIIDEATQAIELDTLIPLQYGVSKLILVGDPEQLCPTVVSQDAQKNKLNMSLFQRLDSYFRYNTIPQRNPVIFLDTQYRMDREIAQFPNSYIYEGKLKTDTEHSKSSLVPYLLFDIREGEEQFSQGSRSMSNRLEAMFTAELCKFILKETKFLETSIGIIAPYSKQRDEVLRELGSRGMKSIEVSTVDGFQGREKHIVIMSCVRAVSGSLGFVGNRNRMNVALTRAKYAMYLVGHFGALQSSDEWKALIGDARQREKITTVSINTYAEDIHSCLINHRPISTRTETEMDVDTD